MVLKLLLHHHKPYKFIQHTGMLLFILLLVLAACSPQSSTTPTPVTAHINEASPSPAITPPPPAELTICTAQEPYSLFLYDGKETMSKNNILEAIYDGPVDEVDGELVPVLLTEIPNLANGGLVLEPVLVPAGTEVIDAFGELRVLQKGLTVRPAGCYQSSCALAWDGISDLLMDQMLLQFTLKQDLMWSDGTPLTAADSVYSYQLAANAALPVSRWAIYRTKTYVALDQHTLEWKGIPGFTSKQVEFFFWHPLPSHAWREFPVDRLMQQESVMRAPLGWGPYRLIDWVPGESIVLEKNPYFFSESQNNPLFDLLTFRFISDAQTALSELQQNRCDLLDSSYGFAGQIENLLNLKAEGLLDFYNSPSDLWIGLIFGISPASYDNGYQPEYGDRVDFFSDVRVRQAFALCIDRQRILDETLKGFSFVPAGLLKDRDHASLPYSYDPQQGSALLESVGWKDTDSDPQTPRIAWGVAAVPMGTPLQVTLSTSDAAFDQQTAAIISDSASACGIKVVPEFLPVEQLFAPGPDGVLFGRRFDLAMFTWSVGDISMCNLYNSRTIPNASNTWIGSNLGGFFNPDYDYACLDAVLDHTDSPQVKQQLQTIFNELIPAVSLLYIPRVLVFSPGFSLPATGFSPKSDLFWLEKYPISPGF